MGLWCGSSRPSLKDVVACVCACGNNAVVYTFTLAINTLFTDWQETFLTDRGTTASVQSVCMGVTNGAGFLAGLLERKLGQRRSLLLGSFLSTLGFFAGGLANSISVLVCCVGVMAGIGFSISFLANMSCALQRFSNRASFVSSAMVLTSGTAMLVFPFLLRYFTETYSWRGCLFLTAGITFHSSFFSFLSTSPLLCDSKTPDSDPDALLMSSPPEGSAQLDTAVHTAHPEGNRRWSSDLCATEDPTHFRDNELASEPPLSADGDLGDKTSLNSGCFSQPAFAGKDVAKDSGEKDPTSAVLLGTEEASDRENVAESAGGRGRKWYRQVRFLTSPLYVCIVMASFLNLGLINAFIVFVLDYASYQGWALWEGLFLNSMFMASNLASRALVTVMSLHPSFNCIVCLGVTGLIGGLAVCLVGQVYNRVLASCLYVAMAVGYGSTGSLFSPCILRSIGGRGFSLGLGLCLTLIGVSSFACTALAGFIIDRQDSYSVVSLVYGLSMLVANALLLVVFRCCNRNAASGHG